MVTEEMLAGFRAGPGSPAMILKYYLAGKRYPAGPASRLNFGQGWSEARAQRALRIFLMMYDGQDEASAAAMTAEVLDRVRPADEFAPTPTHQDVMAGVRRAREA
jgi:hypothetical protein